MMQPPLSNFLSGGMSSVFGPSDSDGVSVKHITVDAKNADSDADKKKEEDKKAQEEKEKAAAAVKVEDKKPEVTPAATPAAAPAAAPATPAAKPEEKKEADKGMEITTKTGQVARVFNVKENDGKVEFDAAFKSPHLSI